MACAEMESTDERWRLQAFISIATYSEIHMYDEQAFNNMREESEK